MSAHGRGKVALRAFGRETSFAELSYKYPLKLLSPRLPSHGTHPVAVAYVVSYGGGLVPGDSIHLDVDVGDGAALVLLTQGSTKVFKSRRRDPASAAAAHSAGDTTQHMTVAVRARALLLLLADPVTCFRAASYTQQQTVRLAPDASLVLLDWFTAGRVARGEHWAFAKYHSVNEVWRGPVRLARDATLLQPPPAPHTLAARLAPYACYATLLLFGPAVAPVVARLHAQYHTQSQMQLAAPPRFIWAMSMLDDGAGCVVRAAGEETELVKDWLREALRDLEHAVGKDVYAKAFV